MVEALRETFITEDSAFASLFTLDDATIPFRVEANNLLYSTLELLSPAADWMDCSNTAFPLDGERVLLEFARRLVSADTPFQGTAEMLAVRVLKNVNPHDAISTFSNALAAARRRSTVDDEDVKALFIKALDVEYYIPVTSSRLLLSTTSDPPWTSFGDPPTDEKSDAASDLVEIVLDLKRQVKALPDDTVNTVSKRGFTPRADKPYNPRTMKHRPSRSAGIAIACETVRATGTAIVCGARSGPTSAPCNMNSFTEEIDKHDYLAARFQHAIDNDNAEELFDALCILAPGGKPEMLSDIFACSFCVGDGESLVTAVCIGVRAVRVAG
ncbi:hypothetical protein CYMTET_12902 [Cymbomonas tetramitiformis]|uniref:Uncharacterized protein n=1 Tax=Cymbomonas tetramitiformis TaxID=36881 RepID=A0AAE0GJI1_9CHLO|nr:hypothetical protein CYMTET_12902 [Cymbomonas tetramitiformis]